MGVFNNFSDTLPDPDNIIADTGNEVGGTGGPGYSEITLKANTSMQQSASKGSGRRSVGPLAKGFWSADISYNELPREQFDIIHAYLSLKQQTLEPFYVNLPQYNTSVPTDKVFAGSFGVLNTEVYALNTLPPVVSPRPGDMFRFTSATYTGIYKILTVETKTGDYTLSRDPFLFDEAYHVWPDIPKEYSDKLFGNVVMQFTDIKLYSRLTSEIKYELGDDNLYKISVSVEEVIPNV